MTEPTNPDEVLDPEVANQGLHPQADYDNLAANFPGGPYLHEQLEVPAKAEVAVEVAGEPTEITLPASVVPEVTEVEPTVPEVTE